MSKKILLSLLLITSTLLCKSQEVKNIFTNYLPSEKLPAYSISKLVQDSYGFIWMTSQQGLHCFDGKSVSTISYDYKNPSLFRQNHTRELYLDGDSLWVCISYGGVSIIDVKKRISVASFGCNVNPTFSCDFTNWPISMSKSLNNEMWIGSYESLFVYSKETQKFTRLNINPFTNKQEDFTSRFISIDSKNRVWVGIDFWGIAVYDGNTKKLIATLDKRNWKTGIREDIIIKKIFPDEQKGMLVATNLGVFKITENNGFNVSSLPFNNPGNIKGISKDITSITKDKQSHYFFATTEGCFETDNGFNIQKLYNTYNSNLVDNYVYEILVDKDNNTWIAALNGISLLNNKKKAFAKYPFDTKNQLGKGQFLKTLAVNDSLLLTATGKGLFTLNLNDGTFHQMSALQKKEDKEFYAINKLPTGQTITSSRNHLYIVDPFKKEFQLYPAEKLYPELATISTEAFVSIIAINDSIVLFGSEFESGIFSWNLKSKKILNYKRIPGNNSTPSDNSINHISKDKENNVWVQTDMALMRFDWQNGVFLNYYTGNNEMPFNSTVVYDLYDDGDFYWIATYGGGLSRVNKKTKSVKYITTKEGLCNNCIFTITPDHDYLWATSHYGISRINRKTLQIKNFFTENGLHGNSFDERSASSYGPWLFFSGLTGITRVDTRKIEADLRKPVTYITSISYNKKDSVIYITGLNPEKIRLPSFASNIIISLSAISFPEGGLTKFAYRIPKLNHAWIQTGPVNTISLTGLSYGKYILEVKSYSSEGEESAKVTELEIIIHPAWYQSLLFKITVLLIIAALLYILYKYRVNQLKRIEKMRKTISGDLHDEIGSTLSSINIYAGLAKKEINKDPYLDSINQNVTDVVNKLDDLVWSINPKYDSVNSIVSRIYSFAEPLTKAKEIIFAIKNELEGTEIKLPAEAKHNIYLITKELITNAIKHSCCTKISVIFYRQHKKLLVAVEDNGIGFDKTRIQSDRNGVTNIAQRMVALKGNFSIESRIGKGTKAAVTIPI